MAVLFTRGQDVEHTFQDTLDTSNQCIRITTAVAEKLTDRMSLALALSGFWVLSWRGPNAAEYGLPFSESASYCSLEHTRR